MYLKDGVYRASSDCTYQKLLNAVPARARLVSSGGSQTVKTVYFTLGEPVQFLTFRNLPGYTADSTGSSASASANAWAVSDGSGASAIADASASASGAGASAEASAEAHVAVRAQELNEKSRVGSGAHLVGRSLGFIAGTGALVLALF